MRHWLSLIAGLGLVGGTAFAENPPMGGDTGDQHQMMKMQGGSKADEPKKHLGEIDIYLRDAINNTKVLYNVTQMQPGKLDATIQKEGINNLDKAITGALTHVQHIKTLPEAKVQDTAKLDALQTDLNQVKQMVPQLRSSMKDRDMFASLTSQVFTRLKDADDNFSTIADKQNLTRVEKLSVPEKQPVKGGGEMERPFGSQPTEKPLNQGIDHNQQQMPEQQKNLPQQNY